ncbi:hypothetical protein FIBSPDRAFT_1053649, partial [Athelia psychrophila]
MAARTSARQPLVPHLDHWVLIRADSPPADRLPPSASLADSAPLSIRPHPPRALDFSTSGLTLALAGSFAPYLSIILGRRHALRGAVITVMPACSSVL